MSDHNSFLEDASEVVPEDSVSQAGVTPTQGGTQGDDPEMEAAQKKLASLRERNPLYDFFNLVRRGSVISLVCRTCLDEKLRPTKPLKFDPASGTSNLTNHMKERHKMDARKRKAGDDSETTSVVGATPGQSIRDYFGGSGAKKRPKLEANLENHRVAEVAWIVRRDIPFAEVESEDYRLKEKMLNRDYVPISADTVSRYISQMYDQAKSHVKSQLQSIPGRASFTWDVWTTDHHPRQFLAIVLHAVSEDWEKMEVPFGFEHITNHTGEGMAAVFQNITEDMNIFRKFVAATTDNASDNGAMIVKLSALHRDLGVKYDPKEIWGRCMGHVVNLICQAMLKNLGALPPSDAEQDKAEADEAPEDMVPEDDMNFEEEEEETIDFGFIPMANMQMSAPANKKKRQVPTPIQKALNKHEPLDGSFAVLKSSGYFLLQLRRRRASKTRFACSVTKRLAGTRHTT